MRSAFGNCRSARSRIRLAKSTAARLYGNLDLAPGPMIVEKAEQIGGSVALILAIVALELGWLGRIGRRTSRSARSGSHRSRTTGGLDRGLRHRDRARPPSGRRIRHRSAERTACLCARASSVFRQAPAHGFPRAAGVRRRAGPVHPPEAPGRTRPPCGSVGTGGGDQRASSSPESFRFAPGRGCSPGAAGRLPSTKRRIVRYSVDPPTATFLAISTSPAPASAASRTCAHLTCVPMPAGAQKCGEFRARGSAEFDAIAYVHPCLLSDRGTDAQLN